MPWGYSLELELKRVEMASGYLPVSGGMRLGFTPREEGARLPELHAGDEISALTEARLPLMYKDDGAFDRRVLENFRVQRLLLGRETAAPAFVRLKALAANLGIPLEHERRAGSFMWDGVQVDILWPEIAPEEIAPLAKNNDSIVIRLQYGERTILLTGDAEKQAEYEMLSENEASFLHADVLKVGHHGSKNSTMPEFLEAVSPRVSVISSGEENPYGHPSPELLERLQESGTRILRTDENGAVRILTDGHTIQVSCYTGCKTEMVTLVRAQAPDQQQHDQQ